MSITTTRARIAAVLDLGAPARVFGDTAVRAPDFIDEMEGTAVWVGDDAAVEVDLLLVDLVPNMARMAGWHLRVGNAMPKGVVVKRFDRAPQEASDPFAWHLLREAVGTHEIER